MQLEFIHFKVLGASDIVIAGRQLSLFPPLDKPKQKTTATDTDNILV